MAPTFEKFNRKNPENTSEEMDKSKEEIKIKEDEKSLFLKGANDRVKKIMKVLIVGGLIAMGPVSEVASLVHFAKDKTEWTQKEDELIRKKEEIGKIFGEILDFDLDSKYNSEKPKMFRVALEHVISQHVLADDSQKIEEEVIFGREKIPLNEKFFVDAETINKIMRETFPKGWTFGSIKKIDWKNKIDADESFKEYGMKGSSAAGTASRNGELSIITLGSSFLSVLSHEIGHYNDWKSKNLNMVESSELVLKIGERIKSEGRYKSSYVESINNPDKQKENYYKATEYWAEICEQFFTDPTQLPDEDFAIIYNVISKTDPDFSISKANELRNEIMIDALADQAEKIYGNN
ncbi:MAG: hypothetical protein WA055_02635 [Candidatus Moraniibacteriota bacterium]